MAGQHARAVTANIATGTSAKTLLQLVAAANHGVKVTGWGISFKGTSVTAEPILVELVRQTTAGTMSTLTPVKSNDSNGDTLDTTAQHTATAEPTTTDVLRSVYVHPQGNFAEHFPFGAEVLVGAGDRVGLRVTAAADVGSIAFLDFEE